MIQKSEMPDLWIVHELACINEEGGHGGESRSLCMGALNCA